MESDETYDAFPYISSRTETNTINLNWLYEINAFLSSSFSFTRTSFDYGLEISNYYRVLDQNQEVFELDDDYDYNTAYNNILRFEEENIRMYVYIKDSLIHLDKISKYENFHINLCYL